MRNQLNRCIHPVDLKSEYRNSKQIQMSNDKNSKLAALFQSFENLNFFIVSNFVLRASNL